MGKNDWLIIGGLAIGAGLLFWKRCELFDWCEDIDLDKIISEHNKKPFIVDKNMSSDDVRSTRMGKMKQSDITTLLENQKIKPGTKAYNDPRWAIYKPKSSYANSLFAAGSNRLFV